MKLGPTVFGIAAAVIASSCAAVAQTPASPGVATNPTSCLPRGWREPQPSYESVEVLPDGRVTFRICAPAARQVQVASPDLGDNVPSGTTDGVPTGLAMVRTGDGLWTATTAKAVAPDVYRFSFLVDGVSVPDPRGRSFSEKLDGIVSTFDVPGTDVAFQAYRSDVPHGVVSEIEYWSASLGVQRRAHVYTPPGYIAKAGRYPVLYLVHGAGDSDDSWTTIGRANYILDNLIAAGKATPMIVVMPAGHTPARPGVIVLRNADFGRDLTDHLIPYIDRTFRTRPEARSRAMAGLSMGGAHTLNFGLTRPELFNAVGIFSIGLGVDQRWSGIEAYEREHAADLRRAAKAMKLVYYAVGRDDFLYSSVAPTRAMLERAGVHDTYVETDGGHTWRNWRRYFLDFAPRIFR